MKNKRFLPVSLGLSIFTLLVCLSGVGASIASAQEMDYRVLATSKTSTMEKEMQEAAAVGFGFKAVVGGKTGFGGSESVVIMQKPLDAEATARYEYKLLATKRTSTMQKELQEAADAGYRYKDQTVYKSRFGGDEVVTILERPLDDTTARYEYKLLATKRTSTMQKELQEAGAAGFQFVGVSVGGEVISILERKVE